MVKKLEKGSILQSSCNNSTKIITRQKQDNKRRKVDYIKCFKCSHMGHYASMCSFKEDDKSNQSKRQRSLAQRRCFGCHEKGHKIEACVNQSGLHSGKSGGTGFDKPVAPVFTEKSEIKLNKGFLKAQAKFKEKKDSRSKMNVSSNFKHKICYTCRQKGHLGWDCPNSKISKLNLAHNENIKLRMNSNDSCAAKMVVTQRTSTKAIWAPKSLVTNRVGPNTRWVPKCA